MSLFFFTDEEVMIEIAHRLGANYGLENSLQTLNKTCQLKTPAGVETDIQFSKDGVPFLMHDKLIDRTTTGKGFLSGMTSEEIRQEYRLNDGSRVPMLSELLERLVGTNIILYAEMVEFGRSLDVMDKILKHGSFPLEQVVFSSFNHHDLRAIKNKEPRAKVMALIEASPVCMETVALSCQADEVGFGFESICANSINACQRIGVKTFAWTVNHPFEKKRAENLMLDGVFTDVLNVD